MFFLRFREETPQKYSTYFTMAGLQAGIAVCWPGLKGLVPYVIKINGSFSFCYSNICHFTASEENMKLHLSTSDFTGLEQCKRVIKLHSFFLTVFMVYILLTCMLDCSVSTHVYHTTEQCVLYNCAQTFTSQLLHLSTTDC